MIRWIPLATICLVSMGCQEASIGTRNATPTITISSHFDGDQVLENTPFVARATAGDADNSPDALVVKWFAGGELACQNEAPDDEGLSECEITMWTDSDPPRIQVEVRDNRNASSSDAVDVEVLPIGQGGDGPTVRIEEPSDAGITGLGEALSFVGVVSDIKDNPPDMTLVWNSSIDGVFNEAPPLGDGRAQFVEFEMSGGQHVITLTATDTDGNTASDIITHTINGLPSQPVVSITPNPPSSSDDLLANIDVASNDPEGDPITYRYVWLKDGIGTGDTSALITSASTNRAETWTVRVTPNDGLSDGPFGEASVIIDNAPPTIQTAVITPDPAYTDDLLTVASTTDDADGDPVTVTYEWTVNGVPTGGNSNTLSGVTDFDRDDLVQVEATPNDGSEDGPTVGSNIVTIQNSPPTEPVVSVAPTAPVEQTDDLICSVDVNSTDPDGDLVTYSFAWEVDGLSYPQVGDLGPFTTVYTGDSADMADTFDGDEWECLVTATDGSANSTPGTDMVTIGQYSFLPDYNGTFGISPTVVYNCGLGAVNINMSTMVFAEVGGNLHVTGAPTLMRQIPAPVDENFSARGVIPGTCQETYIVSGSFSDNDNFSGLFDIQFNGILCVGCQDQSYPITGVRQ